MDKESFDIVVIGAGPGGYVAAIRAAQLGLKAACVDKRPGPGGTCLNVGCIPSKALLHSSELFDQATHGLATHGVNVDGPVLDLAAMMARKNKVVTDLCAGVEGLFRKNKVAYFRGAGTLTGKNEVTVALNDGGTKVLAATNVVIATGSDVTPLPGVKIDEARIVSSTGALSLDRVPQTMAVIGGGYIGLELGSVWRRLGAKVTVVEFLERIVPGMDSELAKQLQRVLTRQGMTFRLGTKVTGTKVIGRAKKNVRLTLAPAGGSDAETMNADIVLVSIGRRPHIENLGAVAIGVVVDESGRILVDDQFRTNVEGIYAIGDVIRGPMLAHKAEEEGIAVAEIIAGGPGHVNYRTIPGVVYTWPEAATVGQNEEELKAAGVDYKVGKFAFLANSRGRANATTDGFVKILADAQTDQVLGVHILGPGAGEMISEAVTVMEFAGSAEDIARTCHAHPTLSEALREAALAVDGRAIHA